MYRLDGKLIAMATLDILPSVTAVKHVLTWELTPPQCVSSVYFVYDPAWERYSLGKVGRVVTLCHSWLEYCFSSAL